MGITVAEWMVLSVNPHLVNQEAKSSVGKEKDGSLGLQPLLLLDTALPPVLPRHYLKPQWSHWSVL